MSQHQMSRLKRRLRYAAGKFITRLQGYAADYQQQQRRTSLAGVCQAHPTANIGSSAGFANGRKKPDDIAIGANSAVLGELITLPQGGRIAIGERTFIGPATRIWSACSIVIGNHVLVAHNVNIHDNISHSLDWRERRAEVGKLLPQLTLTPYTFDLRAKPIVIEDDVWIGFGASIMGGVHIGRGAIIGAGTMVTKDVPAFTLVVGNPMRIVRTLSEELVTDDAR
jgi:acetyltransferase-like isoleucine patch superfamily enzyme